MARKSVEIGSSFSGGGPGSALKYGGRKKFSAEATIELIEDGIVYVESKSLIYVDGGTAFTLSQAELNQEITVINRTASTAAFSPSGDGGANVGGNAIVTLVFDGTNWKSSFVAGALPSFTERAIPFGDASNGLEEDAEFFTYNKAAHELYIGGLLQGTNTYADGFDKFFNFAVAPLNNEDDPVLGMQMSAQDFEGEENSLYLGGGYSLTGFKSVDIAHLMIGEEQIGYWDLNGLTLRQTRLLNALGRAVITQSDSAGADTVLDLNQADADAPFLDWQGTEAVNGSIEPGNSLSAVVGVIKVRVNGVDRYMQYGDIE